MTRVSAIIPAYNRAHTITQAIRSVLAQSEDRFELIIVDDGSTDATCDVVGAIHDPRIKYVRYEGNRGSGFARNKGLEIAEGEYVAFLDSDDEWLPEKLRRQTEYMDALSPEWGVCITGALITKNDEPEEIAFTPSTRLAGDVARDFVLGRVIFQTPTVMIRREVIDVVGNFDDRLLRGQDLDLMLRALMKFKLAVLTDKLARIHLTIGKPLSSRVETSQAVYRAKHEEAIRQAFGARVCGRFNANSYLMVADTMFRDGRRREGLQYAVKALSASPTTIDLRYLKLLAIALRSLGRTALAR